MKTFEFNTYKKTSLQIYHSCKNCGNEIRSEEIYFQYFNEGVEKNGTSCQACNEVYPVRIRCTKLGKGYLEIDYLTEQDDIKVDVYQTISLDYAVDPKFRETYFKRVYDGSIYKIEELNRIRISNKQLNKQQFYELNEYQLLELNNYQNNLLYSSIITSMEAYLSDAFIYLIAKNDEYLKNLVNTDETFKEKKKEPSKEEVIKNLKGRSFHNTRATRKLYQKSFKLKKFPDTSHLIPLTKKRNDIVHRNGKTVENEDVTTDRIEINETILQVSQLVQEVENIILDL